MKSYFPDINVWVALAYRGHQHHPVASSWFERLKSGTAGFCRLTQLGFLRLLTHPVVMRDEVMTQLEAWKAYDLLSEQLACGFLPGTKLRRHRNRAAIPDGDGSVRTPTVA
jgi:predicted nucleic acid-binding protein